MGFFWWLILTVIVVNRIIFHHPIPQKLLPTLFILFAPPIIGFIALTKLLGELHVFGNMLYYFGLFLFILIAFQWKLFYKLNFNLPWWAYSFPLDALAIGTFLMFEETKSSFFYGLSWILFLILNMMILLLVIKTTLAIRNKTICIFEEE